MSRLGNAGLSRIQSASTNVGDDNGFISNIKGVFNRLLEVGGETASQLLPVWTAQQLGLDNGDERLERPTFRSTPQNQNNFPTTQNVPNTEGTVSINTNTVLLIGGGVLLGLILLVEN